MNRMRNKEMILIIQTRIKILLIKLKVELGEMLIMIVISHKYYKDKLIFIYQKFLKIILYYYNIFIIIILYI